MVYSYGSLSVEAVGFRFNVASRMKPVRNMIDVFFARSTALFVLLPYYDTRAAKFRGSTKAEANSLAAL